MFRIFNERTKRYLMDEYGSIIEFHELHTAQEYYGIYCSNMLDVVIINMEGSYIIEGNFYKDNKFLIVLATVLLITLASYFLLNQ